MSGAGHGVLRSEEEEKLAMTQHAFKTVSSQLLFLGMLAEYLQFLDIIPSLAVEVAHRVVELTKVLAIICAMCMPSSTIWSSWLHDDMLPNEFCEHLGEAIPQKAKTI